VKVASKIELNRWISGLSEKYEVIAPQQIDGHSVYKPIENPKQIDWNFTKTVTPIKEFFFNRTEQILTITRKGSEISLQETLQTSPRVILGVRPCDAHGMQVLDALFLDTPPADRNYEAHRENTILVGLACQTAGETCFCTSMGGAPDSPEGLDILLFMVPEGMIVETISDRGESLIESLDLADMQITKPDPPEMAQVPTPDQTDWKKLFGLPLWEQTADRCLSCRVCAYVCPTCRCFDVRDEPVKARNGTQEFERIRVWDSCASVAYRKIAGGHNPRQAKAERLRNRFLCKFDYYPAQYGPMACTGCGRCVAHCPVNIDITEILIGLTEMVP
jgi:ferredoxin